MSSSPESGPLFVVGMPRSGTTLLSAMLDALPDVAITPELHYFTEHWPRCRAALAPGGEGASALLAHLLTRPGFVELQLDETEVSLLERQVAEGEATHQAVYSAVLRAYATRHGERVAGEKTPAYLLRTRLLLQLFPGARFICMVRDPRDVSLSWRTAGWRGHSLFHGLLWRRFSRAAHQASTRLGESFLVVRYEDLVSDPAGTIATCCDHLSVAWDPVALEFHREAPRTFDPGREPWKERALTPVDPGRAGRWRDELPPAEARVVTIAAGSGLARFGYETLDVPLLPIRSWGAVRRASRDMVDYALVSANHARTWAR